MFSKKSRYSFKKGLPNKVLPFPSFSLRYEKNEEGFRVAVVVSKKVDKSAVVRNKVKRKVLDILRDKNAESLPYNLIFYLRRNSLENKNLDKDIEEALQKIKNV